MHRRRIIGVADAVRAQLIEAQERPQQDNHPHPNSDGHLPLANPRQSANLGLCSFNRAII